MPFLGPYNTWLRCSFGDAAAGVLPIALADYSQRSEPVIRTGTLLFNGRVGTKFTIACKGWVEGATDAEFNDNLWAVKAALSGQAQDFRIYGPGDQVEVSMLAARCIDRGPHVTFDIGEQLSQEGGRLRKPISFTVEGQSARVGGSGEKEDAGGTDPDDPDQQEEDAENHAQRIATRPDGLTEVTRSGELRGPNVETRFNTLRVAFRATYPQALWAMSHEYQVNEAGDALSYTLSAVEQRETLPAAGSAVAVEGTSSVTIERDEQHRLVKTWSYDLLVTGNPDAIWVALRAEPAADGFIIRESKEVTGLRERRLRASFSVLRSADGAGRIMNWTQSFRMVTADRTYEERTFPGLSPVLIERPATLAKLVQSGSAIGAGVFPTEPQPLFAGALLAEPEVIQEHVNDVEKRVSWTYTMAVTGNFPTPSRLGRP